MGRRPRAFICGNYNKDLIENKENIKEFAMAKDYARKDLLKHLGKSLKHNTGNVQEYKKCKLLEEEKQIPKSPKQKPIGSMEQDILMKSSNKGLGNQNMSNNPEDFGKTLKKTVKVSKPVISCDSDLNARVRLNKHPFSEKFDCKLNPFVMLEKLKPSDIQKTTYTSVNDNSNILVDVEKTDNNDLSKYKNNFSGCECYNSLLLKEAVVVLDKLPDSQVEILDSDRILEDDGEPKKVPNKSGKGTKRKREYKSKDKPSKSSRSKRQKVSNESKSSKEEKTPDASVTDFSNDSKSPNGNPWNFKISSWNINGIRAWLEKKGLSYLHQEQPDILCIQETKCPDDKLPDDVKKIEGYHTYWLSGDKDGYSGVGLLTKEKPITVEYGIGISEHDNEGRVITAEYDKFYLVSTYVPNAGRGLVRLEYRMKWDKDFREYLKKLDAKKPVILSGDLNVAHENIDLANPKNNKKNAGFTKEEREGFSTLLKEGFIDTFRHLYPDTKGAYTFWTYMMNARARNVGWRLDYFVISERFTENLCDNVIRKDVFGSDHCPITLFLSL